MVDPEVQGGLRNGCFAPQPFYVAVPNAPPNTLKGFQNLGALNLRWPFGKVRKPPAVKSGLLNRLSEKVGSPGATSTNRIEKNFHAITGALRRQMAVAREHRRVLIIFC